MTTQPSARAVPRRRRPAVAVAAALSLAAVTGSAAPSGAAPKKPALEVYFLLDATGDMQPARDVVQAAVDSISARLAKRTELRHGYGVFRDITVGSVWLSDLYQRLAPVRPNGGKLPPTFRYSGGGDQPEGHTFALDAAIGVRHDPWTTEWTAQPAEFTPGARKLIVLVTSASPKQGLPYPGVDETVARLRAAGVGVAALRVSTHNIDRAPVRRDLARISAGTGALARSAVDCDGDRRVDITRGAPLVCEVLHYAKARQSFAGFADAIAARYAR